MSCSSAHHTHQAPQAAAVATDVEVPAISVNGIAISEEAIAREVENHSAPSLPEAIKLAARALVVRELLLQKARAEGLDATLDEEAQISELLNRQIQTPKAGESECRAYFAANRDKFTSPALVEANHILLAAAPDDAEKRAEQKALGEQLIATLQTQPEAFVSLARQHSVCPSKDVGGSLGQLTRGSTVAEFDQVMFAASAGLFPQPIESRYGFHVLRVDRRVEGEPLPFEAVEDKIGHYLDHQVYRRAISQYIGILAGEAEIEGMDFEGADSPLVQ